MTRPSRPSRTRRAHALAVSLAVVASTLFALVAAASPGNGAGALLGPGGSPSPDPPAETKHDTSPPLRSIPPSQDQRSPFLKDEHETPHAPSGTSPDPVVQSNGPTPAAPTNAAPATATNFNGVGQGFSGPQGTMTVNSVPPDTDGDVGLNHYVQIVNASFAVFSKTGSVIYGPVATKTLWSGFGNGCATNNDGDATVKYDKKADRWVISQFSVSSQPYLQCVAVSTSGDPTGSYNRYSFQYANFPDYPKLGVWPDAYYETLNMFSGNTFVGPEVCAYNRTAMLAGQSATQQCFLLSSPYGSVLPSDLDGPTAPPAGSPNFIVGMGTNSLNLWRFHVDWNTTANTTLTGPVNIPVAAFQLPCGGAGGACVTQPGTSTQLDTLGDRVMYRLAYRNFGDHESLAVSHTVAAGSSTGMRWYELRSPNGSPSVYQQGTYAPDANFRWMGSLAMDHQGDIGVGYSVSSTALAPGIRYSGRLVGDPLGQLSQGESVLQAGTGSQTTYNGQAVDRWGDYSSMSVDPADDCTFWYTNQYLPSSGVFNWRTRIGSFKFPSCSGSTPSGTFVSSFTPTTLRNNHSGWVGMRLQIGGSDLSVSQVGRMVVSGNSASHVVKFVTASTGADLAGGSATVATSGQPAGSFAYATLASPVTLKANTAYYIVSQEVSGGDFWYDYSTNLVHTSVASIPGQVWSAAATPSTWTTGNYVDQGYVPTSFIYGGSSPPAPPPPPPPGGSFITSFSPTTLRNNHSGWVGMRLQIGGSDLSVSQVGRMVVSGNSASHVVKFVTASTGADLPGGSATVATAGQPANVFAYASLASPVTLKANTAYYIVSQEVSGGDFWYDYSTNLVHTSVATVPGQVWSAQATPSTWTTGTFVDQGYVPTNFIYGGSSPPPPPPGGSFITSFSPTTLRNNHSGWVGMRLQIGGSDLSVSQVGRMVVSGNSATHVVKFVTASTGADLAGGSATVATSGQPAGSFAYATLASPVTLKANTAYYIVSQEVSGGDFWYDYSTNLVHTSAATVPGQVWSAQATPSTWTTGTYVDQGYVPTSFIYG